MVALFGVFASFSGVRLAKIKMEQEKIKVEKENEAKMATKAYVLDKVSSVDTSVLKLDKKVDDYKHDNEREHDNIRKEVSEKLDLIIELVKAS